MAWWLDSAVVWWLGGATSQCQCLSGAAVVGCWLLADPLVAPKSACKQLARWSLCVCCFCVFLLLLVSGFHRVSIAIVIVVDFVV